MALYVGKVLNMRPGEILDTWGVPELIVTFGEYANEEAEKNYQEWKSLGRESRANIPKPERYIVRFYNED